MASYFNCGFARVAVHNIVELGKKSNRRIQLHGNQESEQEKFHKRFQNRAIDNDNSSEMLISFFHKKYLAQFSEDSWKKLSPQANHPKLKHCIAWKIVRAVCKPFP